ncbi:MAG: MerR family transcriptional regulator [Candidatus Latescibacterota bacterium]
MTVERKRLYYSISEVAEITGLKPHILRFWECEFTNLRPRKNRAGNRAYTERDIKMVKLIKNLLYGEKYTIEGAKTRLKTDPAFLDTQLSLPLDLVGKKQDMAEIHGQLLKLLDMVDAL